MDAQTIAAYELDAGRYASGFESLAGADLPYLGLAATFFRPGETVADLGCGSGRDAAWLQANGYSVTGYDAVEAMLAEAGRRHPALKLSRAALPDLAEIPAGTSYQNLLCSAVLMHLPAEQHLAAIFRLAELLVPGGRLILTYRYSQSDTTREADGRLFTSIIPGRLELMLGSAGLTVLLADTQPDGRRPGLRWQTVVAEKAAVSLERGLNRLQSILVTDRKDATYKLALLRALCDISRAEANQVVWGEHQVFIPLAAVARWWLRYYWPLVTSAEFISQKRGEEHGNKPLAFRASVAALAGRYGTLFNALRALDDNPRIFQPHLRQIAHTIRVGPVKYAGGPAGPLFSFHASGSAPDLDGQPLGWIGVPLAIWLDLTRYEHWIRDSAILHWAELTAEMNHVSSAGPYLGLLLETPGDERDTSEVRQLLAGQPDLLQCVWSGRPVRERFEVDHVIPYSLWGNNDLWNLLPAHPAINQKKRDSLPARKLIERRRDAIIGFWQAYRVVWPVRFSAQLGRALAGGITLNDNWEKPAFAALQETVERVAAGRDLRRWEPGTDIR